MVAKYHIIGASGRSGAALCRSLLADGEFFAPVVRNASRWAAGLPGDPHVADLADPAALQAALAGAACVVSCAHARHIPSILAAAPEARKFVFLGSTRKFTRWPDAHGNGVLAGEGAFVASGRSGVILHPTMIYGAQGEDNVQRLARLLRWLPVVPLPEGGRALVQPIFQGDVTRCLRAAMRAEWTGPETMVVAGPTPMRYADFVRAIASAYGLAPPRNIAVSAGLLRLAARASRLLPFVPSIGDDELRRLTEDKAFDIGPMRATLHVDPVDFRSGLSRLEQTAF